jgi:putative intracellular protease/amidase
VADFDAIVVAGGQAPLLTFDAVHDLQRTFAAAAPDLLGAGHAERAN